MNLIIEIRTLPNGGHRNHKGNFNYVPDGWAFVPENIELVNFPFGEIEVKEIDGVMTVTKWTPGTKLEQNVEPENEDSGTTIWDDIDAMLVDHEYRLTLMELGVNE